MVNVNNNWQLYYDVRDCAVNAYYYFNKYKLNRKGHLITGGESRGVIDQTLLGDWPYCWQIRVTVGNMYARAAIIGRVTREQAENRRKNAQFIAIPAPSKVNVFLGHSWEVKAAFHWSSQLEILQKVSVCLGPKAFSLQANNQIEKPPFNKSS